MNDDASSAPHYHGHRERLRARFMEADEAALADYELMELVLFRAVPRRDVKPLAKTLIARFGSFAEVVAAAPARLREIEGVNEAILVELKLVRACAIRITRESSRKRHVLTTFTQVIDYCRAAMAYNETEEFRVLFLDKKNHLIGDEVMGRGTVDHAPVYPREIIRRALELNASALVLAHNHPSGDPSPSKADIVMTQEIIAIAKPLGVTVHDHLIIGQEGHVSLRGMRLI